MDEIKLDVQIRKDIGTRKIKRIRRENFLPAIVYGGKRGPTAIQVDRRAYEKIMRQNKGQSVVFHLSVLEGEKKLRDYAAIVKEEQTDPVQSNVLHIDFNRISLTEELEVKVPIITKGEAIGVKKDGGTVDQMLRELDVVCLPTNIPAQLELDVEALEIGDALHVKDIVLPSGVKTKHDLEAMVLSVAAPMKEEEEVPVEEEQLSEPEVTSEKKEEEEEGEKAEDAEKAEKKPEEKTKG